MYLWRGRDLGDRLVEAGFNAKGEWNGINLSGGLWYGDFQAPTGYGSPIGSSNTSELDMYAEVGKKFGALNLAAGYIYYNYPQGDANRFLLPLEDSQEVYFLMGYDFGYFQSSLTYFWDIAGADNNGYSELALSRSFPLSHCFSLNLSTNLGYQFEVGECTAWTSKVSLDWAFAEHAKFSPFVAASVALSDNPDDSTYTGGTINQLVGGAMVSVNF